MVLASENIRLVFVCGWIIGVFAIIMQALIEPIIMNNITVHLKEGNNDYSMILLLIGAFLFSSVLVCVANMFLIILKRMCVLVQNKKIIHGLMGNVLCSESRYLKEHEPEQIVTRLSRDVFDYTDFKISSVIELPLVVSGLIFTCFVMFLGSPEFLLNLGIKSQHGNAILATIIILMAPLHLTFLLFNKKFVRIENAQAEAHEKEIQIATESLRGIEDIRSANAFDFALERLWIGLENARKHKTKLFALFVSFQHIGSLTWVLTQVVVLGVSAWLISRTDYDFKFEDYMGFSLICGMFNQYLYRCSEIILGWQRAKPAKRRIAEFENLHIRFTTRDRFTPTIISGSLQFDKVGYKLEERDILCDININVALGEHIAIVGPSGSGKTSLLKLVMCHLRPTEGMILFNGRNIDDIDFNSYALKVSYVSQYPFIFQGTILDNICVGRDIDVPFQIIVRLLQDVALVPDLIRRVLDDEVTISSVEGKKKITWREFFYNEIGCTTYEDDYMINIIERSDFFHVILKDALSSSVGSGGLDLSGGQKAKIAIVRALISNPDVLLLDEITSSLDEMSRRKIMQLLFEKYKNKTILFVTHSLDIICGMDNIYVLDGGRIIQCGKYEKLIYEKGLFREMVSRNSGEGS